MSRIEQLNENAPTKFSIRNYDEARNIITELQDEIRVKMKGKFDFDYGEIQTEIINKVKQLIDVWTPQIDFTVDFHTEEKIVGSKNGNETDKKEQNELANENDAVYDLLVGITAFLANAKYEKKPERKKDAESLHSIAIRIKAQSIRNKTVNGIEQGEKYKVIVPYCELEIFDSQSSINDKIDNWIEHFISVMQYPLLKKGKGIKTIFNSLVRVYDYDKNDETDIEIFVEKVKRLLENNFEFQTVDCQGVYDSTDYFEFTQYPEIDDVVTKRKAIIYKYENGTRIIKGEAYTPCNNSSFMETDETKTSPNEGDVATYNDSTYEE